MSKIAFTSLLIIYAISAQCFGDNANLMHQSHEKLRQAQNEMDLIKRTEDPSTRERLLDEHMDTMREINVLLLRIQYDAQQSGKDQEKVMTSVMDKRIRTLEHMMQQLLENQHERKRKKSN